MLVHQSVLLRHFAVFLWLPASAIRSCWNLCVVLPASEPFALGCFAVRSVPHLGEGVWPAVRYGRPGVLRPQGFRLRGLTGGGSLQPHGDPLGWTRHQRDGFSLQIRARWRWQSGKRKHLVVICVRSQRISVMRNNCVFYVIARV